MYGAGGRWLPIKATPMANNARAGTLVSHFVIGPLCRCPRYGKGILYDGLLHVAEICGYCGLDLSAHGSGDGPAIFVILIVGALAFIVERTFAPPIWAHLINQLPLILGATILCLRPLKATLIALQYRHSVAGFGDRRSV